VLAAMGEVPRHEFVPAELRAFAYLDTPLPIGYDKTISQPFIVALMVDLLEIEPGHRRTLGLLLKGAKAPDRIIYEYALETIRLFLDQATAPVGDAARAAVARSIVRVAEASSRGFFHTQTVTQAERECIGHIASALRLDQSEQAVKDLKQLEPPPVT